MYTLRTPFEGSNKKQTAENIVNFYKSSASFGYSGSMGGMNEHLKDLLNSIFQNEDKRPTMKEILEHPFFQEKP